VLSVREIKQRKLDCAASLSRRRGCLVGEKRGGALCRVKMHRITPDMRYVNGSAKVIVDRHPAPDQHQQEVKVI